jgi:Na+-transporting NADH:ubiquinone oxidoreductase subunit NqrA
MQGFQDTANKYRKWISCDQNKKAEHDYLNKKSVKCCCSHSLNEKNTYEYLTPEENRYVIRNSASGRLFIFFISEFGDANYSSLLCGKFTIYTDIVR